MCSKKQFECVLGFLRSRNTSCTLRPGEQARPEHHTRKVEASLHAPAPKRTRADRHQRVGKPQLQRRRIVIGARCPDVGCAGLPSRSQSSCCVVLHDGWCEQASRDPVRRTLGRGGGVSVASAWRSKARCTRQPLSARRDRAAGSRSNGGLRTRVSRSTREAPGLGPLARPAPHARITDRVRCGTGLHAGSPRALREGRESCAPTAAQPCGRPLRHLLTPALTAAGAA